MKAELETLPSELDSMFLRQPLGEGASARLSFKVGALHETNGVPVGTAHYLEHAAILGGTKRFPNIRRLLAHADAHDLEFYGYTDWTSTTICVDGKRAEDVIPFCLELGLQPRLHDAGIEQERVAITEEAREYEFSDYAFEHANYHQHFVGSHPSQNVTGKATDIPLITPDSVRAFYAQNWQRANARFYVCAQEPVSAQRAITERYLASIDESKRAVVDQPTPLLLQLPWLIGDKDIYDQRHANPDKQSILLQIYNVEGIDTYEEYVARAAANDMLNALLLRDIRFRTPTAYGIGGYPTELDNTHHGLSESYGSYEVAIGIAGDRIPFAQDVIASSLESIGRQRKLAGLALRQYTNWLADKKYYRHYQLVDDMLGSGQVFYERKYHIGSELATVTSLTTHDVIAAAKSLTSDMRKSVVIGHIAGVGSKPTSQSHRS